STNTILHLLAVANEAGVDFKMADIDRLSRVVPCICKTAPNNHDYYMEDVHRAGGIFAILKELDKAGKLHTDVHTIHAPTLKDAIEKWDVTNPENTHAIERFKAAPGGVRTTQAFSHNGMW
ncbi:dihydroxy-acid dehydratase, partial [Enterobacter hormaechei subsp. steigerwaltii]|nr:dihydroxy-acid dehydratase [Enterobacter hormaechei subsp. steigerwaltii]